MEPLILASYVRRYSEIPFLQHAVQVTYTLFETDGHLRMLVCQGGARAPAALCELPGLNAQAACGVLQYLYENAVPVEQVQDVVSDLYGIAGGRPGSAVRA